MADIVCEYREPLVTTVHLNYLQAPERHEYEVVGDRGWAQADFFGGWVRFGERGRTEVEMEQLPQERDDIFRAEHQAFFDAVEGKRPPETSAADGLVSAAICEAAVQSWKTRERVPLAAESS